MRIKLPSLWSAIKAWWSGRFPGKDILFMDEEEPLTADEASPEMVKASRELHKGALEQQALIDARDSDIVWRAGYRDGMLDAMAALRGACTEKTVDLDVPEWVNSR